VNFLIFAPKAHPPMAENSMHFYQFIFINYHYYS
jgi:hypothetical protein